MDVWQYSSQKAKGPVTPAGRISPHRATGKKAAQQSGPELTVENTSGWEDAQGVGKIHAPGQRGSLLEPMANFQNLGVI